MMGADRYERARRDGKQSLGRKRRNDGPPKDASWMWMSRDQINSVAFRALSGNAIKVIVRICEEHLAHGRLENGRLIVTHKQFAEFGIREASVAEAIREAEFFGFINVDRGAAYKGGHEPNIYRLTWLGDYRDTAPTNQWKGISETHVQAWKAQKRSKSAAQRIAQANRKHRRQLNVVPMRAQQ